MAINRGEQTSSIRFEVVPRPAATSIGISIALHQSLTYVRIRGYPCFAFRLRSPAEWKQPAMAHRKGHTRRIRRKP